MALETVNPWHPLSGSELEHVREAGQHFATGAPCPRGIDQRGFGYATLALVDAYEEVLTLREQEKFDAEKHVEFSFEETKELLGQLGYMKAAFAELLQHAEDRTRAHEVIGTSASKLEDLLTSLGVNFSGFFDAHNASFDAQVEAGVDEFKAKK